jgi:hypothetical protein
MTTNDRVQLIRDFYDLPKGTPATVRYVDEDHSVYVIWAGREDLGPDMLTMREARDVLEVISG